MEDNNAPIIIIPKDRENLKLPAIDLIHEYEDENDRRIYLEGSIGTEDDISNDNSMGIVKKILRYNRADIGIPPEKRKPIQLFIDSEGGALDGALVLSNFILQSKTPVYTINMCCAYSAAGIILCCGHKRLALRGSTVLVHTYSAGVDGPREQIDNMKRFYDKLDKRTTEILFSRTKIDAKTYRSKAPKNWFLDDAESLKWGIIDKIVDDIDEIL